MKWNGNLTHGVLVLPEVGQDLGNILLYILGYVLQRIKLNFFRTVLWNFHANHVHWIFANHNLSNKLWKYCQNADWMVVVLLYWADAVHWGSSLGTLLNINAMPSNWTRIHLSRLNVLGGFCLLGKKNRDFRIIPQECKRKEEEEKKKPKNFICPQFFEWLKILWEMIGLFLKLKLFKINVRKICQHV